MIGHEDWLDRTESKLKLAKKSKEDRSIHFSDTMYCIQQVVEFSLKSLIAYFTGTLPQKTHDISNLCHTVEQYVQIPQDILIAILPMTDYVSHRYPHEFEIGTDEDCDASFEIAEKLFAWIKSEVVNH